MHLGEIGCFSYFRVNLVSSSPGCCWGLKEKMLERRKMLIRMEGSPVWSKTLDNKGVLCVWDTEEKRQEERKLGRSRDSHKSQPCLLDTWAGVLTSMKPKAQLKYLQVWDTPSLSYFPAGQPPELSIARCFLVHFSACRKMREEGGGRTTFRCLLLL